MRQTLDLFRRTPRPAALLLVAAAAGALPLTGCVSGQAYDDTAETARALEARNIELAQQVESLQEALASRNSSDSELRDENGRLRQERQRLSDDIANLNDRIAQTNERLTGVRLSGLDPTTDRALRRLATQYADLMSYDAETGRINFASDLTFPSGSDQVRDGAKQGLADLARILRTSGGSGYLVYVEGHTDAQVPSNPNTVRRHPTNRHLSAHRAIAVGNALISEGISQTRIFTGGWGASRPMVANASDGNTPKNRRVELYLVPDTGTGSTPPPAPSGSSDNAPPAQTAPRNDAPMK